MNIFEASGLLLKVHKLLCNANIPFHEKFQIGNATCGGGEVN